MNGCKMTSTLQSSALRFLYFKKFHVVQAEEWIGRKHAGLM
jgi:hypothetical protein